jgi:hypothetical protein
LRHLSVVSSSSAVVELASTGIVYFITSLDFASVMFRSERSLFFVIFGPRVLSGSKVPMLTDTTTAMTTMKRFSVILNL